MEIHEQRRRLAAARLVQERSKRAADGRLRREIREAFARQAEGHERTPRHLHVEPDPGRPPDARRPAQ
jgi:hypothetical protein